MENKRHILLYNSNEPLPTQGGMERVTDLLARALLEKGYSVTLLCAFKNRLGKVYEPPTDLFYLPDEADRQAFFLQLLADRKIDCIIDQTEGGIIGRFGIFKERKDLQPPVKIIAVQHNSTRSVLDNYDLAFAKDFSREGLGWLKNILYNKLLLRLKYLHSLWLTKKLFRELDSNYDRIVTLSPSFIDDFCYYYPKADRRKLLAIPNFNSYESCLPTRGEKRVLFVGRLRNCVKGVDKLLRIWSKVEPLFPDWQLDIVGDGEDRACLEQLAVDLKLKHVLFHGFQSPNVFYQSARIFCMTSIYEGFGMVLTEAMQHGVVPMAFNSYSAVSDIIDDTENGLLITPFDEEAYADRLMYLMKNEERLGLMSKAAIQKSTLFSKEAVIQKWCMLIDNLFMHN